MRETILALWLVGAFFCALAGALLAEDSGVAIPACAWRRPLGDAGSPDTGYVDILSTATRSRKGIPLGGIGAGNFMYNLCGTFGPWSMKPARYEERFLTQAAFHVREEVAGEPAVVRTLAAGGVLPAWSALEQGRADYYALFPKGWCVYKNFKTDIRLTFFSPIIKDNYRETSLPVGVFLFRITNPQPVPVKVSVMFTFPNAPYNGPQNLRGGKTLGIEKEAVRLGLVNRVLHGAGFNAVLMTAAHKDNPAETQNSQWCIAAGEGASVVANWDGAGTGRDIWEDFAADGALAGKDLSRKKDLPSGALAVQVELQPGETKEIPFVLSWYFPMVTFGKGTTWLRRFTEYFPQSEPDQAAEIAREALESYGQWLVEVDRWTRPIIDSPAIPDWLKQGALNELYYSTFGSSFWENGCVSRSKKFGARPGQHLSFVMECQEYQFAETFDVRHHVARVTRELWPQMERDILLLYADFVMDSPDGSVPHDAGGPTDDALQDYDFYGVYYNADGHGIAGRKTTPWSEFSPKFMQQAHAYWWRTHDEAFLKDAWPALCRTFDYQLSTDLDHDGVTEMKSSEYLDNRLFNAVFWIGALEAMQALSDHIHDSAMLSRVNAELDKVRAKVERDFWNPELGYYMYNEKSPILMADAMLGQRYADVTGLAPVLDPQRLTSHYYQLFRRNVLPLPDVNGDGVGDAGVANALNPDSSPGVGASEYSHHFEVWTGVSYNAAANMYHWGRERGEGPLMADALLAGWGTYYRSWLDSKAAYWFSTPEAWRIDDPTHYRALMYQRARAIWELLLEVHDPF